MMSLCKQTEQCRQGLVGGDKKMLYSLEWGGKKRKSLIQTKKHNGSDNRVTKGNYEKKTKPYCPHANGLGKQSTALS